MSLTLQIGQTSAIGPKTRNEDALACITPEPALLASKGCLFALADGVSNCANGKLAAESTVRAVAADYYATPETWEIAQALDRLLTAHNRWLQAQTAAQPLLSTLSVLVLRGRRFTVAHVGDCRVYRLRQHRLTQLTVDHVWDQPQMRHVLKRAVGLDAHLMLDFHDGELDIGDIFLICCDGVWEPLGDQRLHELLELHSDPQRAAEALAKAAHAAGGQDNASAIVVRIEQLAAPGLEDEFARLIELPLPPRLKPGQTFEDMTIQSLLHESRATLLYRVIDAQQREWVLKTLNPLVGDDAQAQQGLLIEEWLQKRLTAHYFAEVKALPERQFLYYLVRWYPGQTLADYRKAVGTTSINDTVKSGIRLCKGLGALHRLNIVHRDIKPDNIHLDSDDKLRILDFGVASCPGLTHDDGATVPGTPSFMAPELFSGSPADVRSDLYAAGVTLYWLLTGHYPYGEIEPFQNPKFGDPLPPTRYRPDLPMWLESVLLKAVAREPQQRFETAEEMLLALQRGDSRPLQVRRASPLLQRSPLSVWRAVALISLLFNLLLFYALLLH